MNYYCTGGGTPQNSMVFMTFTTGGGLADESFTSYMGGAGIWIADNAPPTMGAPTLTRNGSPWNPDSGWVKNGSFTAVTQASDGGLGVKNSA